MNSNKPTQRRRREVPARDKAEKKREGSVWTKNFSLSALLNNKRLLMILSLIIAVVIWAAVSTGAAVEETKTIKNVPIEFDPNGSLYQTFGLRVTSSDIDSVDVLVTGARYVITPLSVSDIKVTAVIGSVSASGEYTLQLRAVFQNGGTDATVSLKSTDVVVAEFDTFETITLPIETEVSGSISIASGYVLGVVTASPSVVQIQGPSGLIHTVKRAVTHYSSQEEKISTSFIQTGSITLLDEEGAAVPLTNVTLSQNSVEVSVPILKRKTVNTAVKLYNAPEGYAERYLKITPATIEIAGTAEVVDNMTELTVGAIDVSTVTQTERKTFTIALGDNLRDVNNVGYITVAIDYSKVRSKSVSVRNFRLEGLDDITNYSVTVATSAIENVNVYARSSDLSSMTSDTLYAVISLDKATLSVGQIELPVTIVDSSGKAVWAVGSYTALVNVSSK